MYPYTRLLIWTASKRALLDSCFPLPGLLWSTPSVRVPCWVKHHLRSGEQGPLYFVFVVVGRLSEIIFLEFVFCALFVPLKREGWKNCSYSDDKNWGERRMKTCICNTLLYYITICMHDLGIIILGSWAQFKKHLSLAVSSNTCSVVVKCFHSFLYPPREQVFTILKHV